MYVTGKEESNKFSNGSWDYFVLKINSETGETIWKMHMGGEYIDIPVATRIMNSTGQLVVLGYSKSMNWTSN